jgi:3-carboxy-cis,cis-muconate cycloisomerase
MEALAAELGLAAPAGPWHAQRDGLAELAGWFALVTGSLGKTGQDLMLLAQSEVAEIRAGEGGGSSTMPQKANPVGPELLVTLARLNAGLLGTVHQAALQEHERGGPGWTLEWLTLPQMAVATGTALRHALALAGSLRVDAARMRRNLDADHGLILAEAASFALAGHMPRSEAQALVKRACAAARDRDRPLIEVLRGLSDAPVDWDRLRDPANALGAVDELIDRILAEARAATA